MHKRKHDFESSYTRDKDLEELIDMLGTTAEPGSQVHEMIREAIRARTVERLAAPQKRANRISVLAAIVSAVAAIVSVVVPLF